MSFWENVWNNEDDEEQNEEEELVHGSNKDSIIFLIDAEQRMFEKNERGEIPFHNSIKCAIATLTDKIISSENDLMGICFYGTKEKKNPNEFDNLFVFMDLDVPDAQKIIELENLQKKDNLGDIGVSSKEFPFCDALWTCSTMFSLCSVKVGHKRIFLFTNEDNPNVGDEGVRSRSLQRAKDLTELNIDIELFAMNRPGKHFDASLFYQNIISITDDEDTGIYRIDGASKFEELIATVRRKEFKKRSIVKIPLILGDHIEISVRLYSLVHAAKKGSFVWLDKNNNILRTVTKYICEDTGSLLMDSQIKYAFPYGGENVIFDKDEILNIKTIDKQGIRLMGFKPRSALKVYHNLKPSLFIYPDEHVLNNIKYLLNL